MFTGNFAIFRHVTRLSTSPTFALPRLLSIRSFIAFTSVFPGTIHSIFANKNHGILIVIGADNFQEFGKAKIFFAVEFALQLFVRDMENHNISHLVIFLFAIVTMFRQALQARNKVVDRFARVWLACKQFLSRKRYILLHFEVI